MPKPAYRGFDPQVLRNRREELGITQEHLAALVDRFPTMVGKWENGQHVPDVATIARLGQVLKLAPQEFTWTPPEHPQLTDLRLWAGLAREPACQKTGIAARRLRW